MTSASNKTVPVEGEYEPISSGNESGPPPILCSTRAALAIIGFFGFMNLYALRVDISVAMVCMVNQTWVRDVATATVQYNSSIAGTGSERLCTKSGSQVSKLVGEDGEFEWSKSTQGIIHSSFFYGYIVTQLPGGWLATRFGGRHVFGWSMLVCALATLAAPLAARWHWGVLVATRVLCGLSQGVVWPAMCCMWAHWSPPLERSRLWGFTNAGAQVGVVLTYPLSGLLCDSYFKWPSIYVVFGGLGIIWCVVWLLMTADSPDQHKRISVREREYIKNSLKGQTAKFLDGKNVPWRAIFTSKPFYGMLIAHTTANWITYTLLTNIPTYLREMLQFDIKKNGGISALPYIGFWAMILLSAFVADFLRIKKIFSVTTLRKSFNTLGMVVPSGMCLIISYLDCRPTLAVVLLVIGVSFVGCTYGSGFVVSSNDIAPKYTGILFGITNTCATVSGILAPYVLGLLTKTQRQSDWQKVFWISVAVSTIGALSFLILGSGEVEPWAKDQDLENELNEMESFDKQEVT